MDPAGNAEHYRHMDSSLQIYRLIVKHLAGKADLSVLCRVNKGFQQAAEQVLYNTINTSNARDSFKMCCLFAETPRLAALIKDLSLFVGSEQDSDSRSLSDVHLPDDFWPIISKALHHATGLRHLSIRLESVDDAAQAWILNGTTFKLHGFHCDLQWDIDLVSFLNTQFDINDLYVTDYSFPEDITPASMTVVSPLDPGALPNLSTLQCTFSEAACALVPARPVSRLKTCFSKTRLPEKRDELAVLFSKLTETTHPLHALDIADSSYSDSFSMELLASVVMLQNKVHNLRYLGTLVLPIDGNARLRFYGHLRRLSCLECLEVDVSEWEPPPAIPSGVRALASELRLYCPSLDQVIFVNDFERTVVAVEDGTYTLTDGASTDDVWKEF